MRREFSAGGLVYKRLGEKILWLVRRPTPNPEYRGNLGWSFPKGLIDEGESVETAALREVKEEGGVTARVMEKLETLKVFFTDQKKEKVMKFITYYLMEFESDAPEGQTWETEEVRWVGVEEANKLLAFKNEKTLLVKAYEKV